MKRSGRCPKCDSEEVVALPKQGSSASRYFTRGRTVSQEPKVYVCTNCGYIEEYLTKSQIRKLI